MQSSSLSDVVREKINEILIEKYSKDANFVIYPFGEGGKILKGILNYEFGIHESAIIDNALSITNPEIEDIAYLKNHQDAIVLISSYRLDQYNSIRENLHKYISLDKCVEIYEKFMFGDNYYIDLLALTKIYAANKGDFIRIGGANDGGYVMIDDMPGGIAYSFGIGDNPSWDLMMNKRGYEVYMYDYTVECPAVTANIDGMKFFQVGIADKFETELLKTLPNLIASNGHNDRNDMILKMDVEGGSGDFYK